MRLARTVRHLRPVQVANRLWRRLGIPRLPRPVDPAPAARRLVDTPGVVPWRFCRRSPSMTGPSTFRFLGETRSIDSTGNWDLADWPRLWRYNLHYFDDLAADEADSRLPWHRALVARWMAENPEPRGTAWEPYPLSLRIVNWLKWSMAGRESVDGLDASLARQARSLLRQREFHLLGNHLWANGKALAFAGCCFQGPDAERWLRAGQRILSSQWDEQVLADGGHFERSPMYHAIFCEDVLDLLQLDQRYPGRLDPAWTGRARRQLPSLLRWLAIMTHPDGEVALFNDAAIGIAPNLAALIDYGRGVNLPVAFDPLRDTEVLSDSGYVRFTNDRAVVIVDVGLIGPDYLPGHAHADTLSLECSFDGDRLLVNGGTSTYVAGPERQRQRGTAAHNTVSIGGRNSSEVWGGFRVGRRARPVDVRIGDHELQASHDGYRHLPGRPTHRRRVELLVDRLLIEDRVAWSSRRPPAWLADGVVAHLLFATGLEPVPDAPGPASSAGKSDTLRPCPVKLTAGQGGMTGCQRGVRLKVDIGNPRWERSSWHPRFGQSTPVVALAVRCVGEGELQSSVELEWGGDVG